MIPHYCTPALQISLGEVIRIQGLQLSSPAFMSSTYMAVIYKQLSAFMFGGMTSCSQTNIAKVTTGHLRPHFLVVCLPYPASFNCESGYTTNYTCTRHPQSQASGQLRRRTQEVSPPHPSCS